MALTRVEREAAKLAAYARRDELVNGLRQLADLFEQNGVDKLPLPDWGIKVTIDTTVNRRKEGGQSWETEADPEKTKTATKKVIRGMGRGKKTKEYNSFSFTCTKEITSEVKLCVQSAREGVCRKVFTGNKIVHAASTSSYTTPEQIEEEFEWVCDEPLLSVPDADAA